MNPTLKISPQGRKLIKAYEGFRRTAAPLPGGGYVIGHGHTKSARPGVSISEDDADKLLIYDLIPVQKMLQEAVSATLTQNQIDAMAALAFDIGVDSFRNSAVLQRANEGRMLEASLAFDDWRCAMSDGEPVAVEKLLLRRAAERALFLTPEGAAAPIPEVAEIPENTPAEDITPVSASTPAVAAEPAPEPEPEPEAGPEPEFEAEAEEIAFEADDTDADAADEIEFDADGQDDDEDEIVFEDDTPEDDEEREDEIGFEPPSGLEALNVADDDLRAREAGDDDVLDQDLDEEETVEVIVEPEAGDDDAEDYQAEDFDEARLSPPVALADDEDAVTRPMDDDGTVDEGNLSWVERAHRRARDNSRPAMPPEARPEDLRMRNSEDEWAVEDESEYSPEGDRTGAVWYVLFLLIGFALAGFGAWDTWQRANGVYDEAFLYGAPIAAVGLFFMAVAGWFLAKRILAFR